MQERYLGRLEPDMDVCDISGEKIGTVIHVYRLDTAAAGATSAGATTVRAATMADAEPARAALPDRDDVMEVKTGFLGLGKHLYVPTSAIQEVTGGGVFLSTSREKIESFGWDEKPPYFDELH